MILPGYYEFNCPVKITSGHKALDEIPEILSALGCSKPVIITDQGVQSAGLIDILYSVTDGKTDFVSVMDDVPPDSDVEIVSRYADMYRESGADSIIALGGGSVLDTAKGVNILVSENSDDLMKFSGAGKLKRKLNPLIAVPTTAGTGSEVTLVAVILERQKNRKLFFTSQFLLPDIAVIDSRMTLTLPPHITAATAMDALAHSVEAYTCLSKNPVSDAHACEAIALILENLQHVVKHPDHQDGRLALATAATLAGMAFSNSMVGVVHTLGHSVGSVCHVPHGTCMAILLPYGLEYNFHKIEHELAELLYVFAGDKVYSETPESERAEKAIECIRKLNQDLNVATSGKHARYFKEVVNGDGTFLVTEDKFEDIARCAMGDGSLFYNPEDLDFNDFMMVIKAAWTGDKLDRELIKKG